VQKTLRNWLFYRESYYRRYAIADAHHTSANYDDSVHSDKTNLEEEYDDVSGCLKRQFLWQLSTSKYLNEYHIKENNTIHITASEN
jgi:hypothetical protein